MTNKALEYLIDENFVYAKVLDYFGVQFYENRGKTLSEVCRENNLDETRLKHLLESSTKAEIPDVELKKYPARLIIEYLKHAHQLFIKDRLPYILKLINALDHTGGSAMISDLKFIMPLFVEDFIKHIYEEEDRLFHYVNILEKISNGGRPPKGFYLGDNNFSIQEFALHHGDSDDEMKGIRGITDQYKLNDIKDIHLKVILQELQRFDHELNQHACIENHILFPKALTLEKRVHQLQVSQASLN